jgi:hypothetical protein
MLSAVSQTCSLPVAPTDRGVETGASIERPSPNAIKSKSNRLLSKLQAKFHAMSVPELFSTLRTYPAMSDLVLTGVASDYYVSGNWKLIDELKRRPRQDLQHLRQHTNDAQQLYQENGPYGSVGMLCQVILDEADGKAVTQELNGSSR